MLRFALLAILFIIVARMFWRLVDAVIAGAAGEAPRGQGSPVKLVRDPVCGTYVAPRAALSVTSGGTTHYFCSDDCRNAYSRQSAAGSRQ
ncbi:MAG: YHS domain-containing protein [Acidobacteria bacterium]|nr:YHS domain-containing protein [Acidobacteriota bacterium]